MIGAISSCGVPSVRACTEGEAVAVTEPDADDPYTRAPIHRPRRPWPHVRGGQLPPYGAAYDDGSDGPGVPPSCGYPAPPPGYPPYVPRTNGKATASMVLALIGLVLWPTAVVLGPLAVIFGHTARREMPLRGETGNGQAVAGLIIGYLLSAFWVLLIFGLIAAGVMGRL